MNDDSMVKIMETLGLDYGPAERSTKAFESRIASLNKQLFELKANAIRGAGDINKAFSSQLGGISGSKMILDQYGQPLKIFNDNTAASIAKSTAAAKQYGKAVQEVAKQHNILGSEFQRRSQWFLTGTVFYGTLKAAKATAQTISEVEMGITEIARVMEDETFVFENYRNELLQLGVDYGQTFDTVQDIALRWAQAGYNVHDSLDNTKTSLLALNTAELDAANATESMIGIMAQWNMTSKDLPLVLDKINKTADDFTVTSQDLVDGLLRSSGAAKIMGLSLDETISLLTVMREASGRTGREVGNALNSILSYVQRPGSIKTLEGLGIQVFADAAKTQFRNVMLIFKDIAANWGTLSADIQDGFIKAADDAGLYSEELANAIGMQTEWNDLQQRDISQAAAGVYRRNYFIGMIERLSEAQGVLNNMTDAAGYSMSENGRTMETLSKKYASLQAAAQELAVALGDAGLIDMLKGLTDGAKEAADSFADLDEGTRALILTVIELLGVMAGIKGVMGLFTAKGIFDVAALLPGWGQLALGITGAAAAIGLFAYNASKAYNQSIADSIKSVNSKKQEIDQTNDLIQKYGELENQAIQTNEVKAEMLDIQRQLATMYPGYVDALDEEGNNLVTNIPLIREMNALKAQELEIERQRLILSGKNDLPKLKTDAEKIQKQIDDKKKKLSSGDTKEWKRAGTGERFEFDVTSQIIKDIAKLNSDLAGKKLEINIIEGALKSLEGTDDYSKLLDEKKFFKSNQAINPLNSNKSSSNSTSSTSSSASYSNDPLDNALRVLEHKKQMNEISLQDEIAYLKTVEALYVNTGEERMDVEERIYNAEKALIDKQFQNSINWINEKKALGELSAEEEIAAWNRVLKNQKNNIEAVKEATQNLYRLQKELREKEVQEQKSSLKGIQDEIKDAYDERIDLIEKEADKKVKAIEEELKLLDREENAYDHDKKMSDLKEELAYWSVRTGEDARKNLADIREQIAEAEHDREVELQKQGLEDEKDAIEDAAEREKEKWQAAYKDMEKAFEDHNLDIIAQAATYSKEAYQQWYDNYIVPMQNALTNGKVKDFRNISGSIGGSIGSLPSHDYGMTDEDYMALMSNKASWWELFNSGNKQNNNLKMQKLNAANDALRAKYGIPAGEYPKFHTGGESLTAGWAQVLPGELFFPSSLSKDLKTLIAISSGITGKVANDNSQSTADNRKQVNLHGPLLNVENMHMEDEIDGEILSRQLYRAVISLP